MRGPLKLFGALLHELTWRRKGYEERISRNYIIQKQTILYELSRLPTITLLLPIFRWREVTPRPADSLHMESNFFQLAMIQNQPSIKDKRRLMHAFINLFIVQVRLPELIPLCTNDDSIRPITSLVCALGNSNLLLKSRKVVNDAGLRKV